MARNILSKVFLLVLGAGTFWACIGEDLGVWEPPKADQAEVTFSLHLPGTASPSTRALDALDEDEVKTADVYVFDNSGMLVDVGYGRNITPADEGNNIMRSFTVTLQVGQDREVMVLANAREVVAEAYPGGVPVDGTLHKDAFQKSLTIGFAEAVGWNFRPGTAGYRPIPMWGTREGVDIDSQTSLSGVANSVKVSRMVARVNVMLGNGVTTDVFKLNSVRVYNYNTTGRLIPDWDAGNWSAVQPYAKKPSLPDNPGFTQNPIIYTELTTADKALKNVIYLYEAEPGTAPVQGTDEYIKNPCVVIGGYYGGSSDETFYRVDFAVQDEDSGEVTYLPILRNHSYNISIKSIEGPGKGSEDEAYKSLPGNIESDVIVWNDYDMEDVWFDGQYYYSVSPLLSELWAYAYTGNKIKIKTDYPKWSYELSDVEEPGVGDPDNVDWIRITSHNPGQLYDGDLSGDYLVYDVDANITGQVREAYVHISAGRFTMSARIEQTAWYIEDAYLTPTGTVSTDGEKREVTIEGFFEDIDVRVREVVTDEELAVEIVPGVSSPGSSTAEIIFPATGWNEEDLSTPFDRTLAIEYRNLDATWKLIRTEDQPGYYAMVESDLEDDDEIAPDGQDFTIEVEGFFPQLWFRAYDKDNDESVNDVETLVAGTTGTVTVNVEANYSQPRTVYLQWAWDSAFTEPVDINYGEQGAASLELSTGRVVAEDDYGTGLNWPQAMGIPVSSYLSAYYYTSYGTDDSNRYYLPTENTGCASYTEPGYGPLWWRLPTLAEMTEMYQIRNLLTPFKSGLYWASDETGPSGGACVTMTTGSGSGYNKNQTSPHIRCVREKYLVTSDLVNGTEIPEEGDTYTLSIEGEYPQLWFRAYDKDNNEVVSTEVVDITAGREEKTVILTVEAMASGIRTVYLQYSLDTAFTTPVDVNHGKQDAPFILSTGRTAARKDASTNLNWSQAMGIPSSYQTTHFYTSYGSDITNRYYVPSESTGCGAYNETDYPAKWWRLPTVTELEEMLSYIYNEYNNVHRYLWASNEYVSSGSGSVTYHTTDVITPNSEKSQTHYIRCVREPYLITSDLVNGSEIAEEGQSYTVSVQGDYPQLWFRAYDRANDAVVSTSTPTVSAGNSPTNVNIAVDAVASGFRTVFLQYSTDAAFTTPVDINYGEQVGPIVLGNTGRIVAKTRTSATNMTWAQAMGIQISYNAANFYTSGYSTGEHHNFGYTHNTPVSAATGCATYWENAQDDEIAGVGRWFLPTSAELMAMWSLLDMASEKMGYWSSSEEANGKPNLASMLSASSWYSQEDKNQNKLAARCVRWPYVVTSNLVNGSEIEPDGEQFTITVKGQYPELWFRAYDKVADAVVSMDIKDIAGGTGNKTVQISIKPSPGGYRSVYLQYSTDGAFTNAIDINNGYQSTPFILSTKRVVASNDVSSATLTWAEGMGVNTTYNTEYFYTTYGSDITNRNYTPQIGFYKGCAAYSEDSYGAGMWRLPTSAEMEEIYQNRDVILNLNNNGYYRTATEINVATAIMLSFKDGTSVNSSKIGTVGSYVLRCVRDQ